mgnify:CR=1 FL=1
MANVTDDLVRLYAGSDALGIGEMVRGKKVKASEMIEAATPLVERLDPQLNAVVIRTFDLARERSADPGEGVFAGVPFLLKNLGTMWKGTPMTWGTPYLKDFFCAEDSEIGRRMKAAGLMPIGRSNTPEYGWCITTQPRLHGATKNPWNADITPGGSSGGTAAAGFARAPAPPGAFPRGGAPPGPPISTRSPAACRAIPIPRRGRTAAGWPVSRRSRSG